MATRLAAERGGFQEMLAALRIARACGFGGVTASCVGGLADHIAAAGSCWPAGLAEALQSFDSEVLTQLLRATGLRAIGSIWRTPTIFDVRADANGGATGGFTYCLQAVSSLGDVGSVGIMSPWAEVSGFRWRLNVYPKGKGDAKGTHMTGVHPDCDGFSLRPTLCHSRPLESSWHTLNSHKHTCPVPPVHACAPTPVYLYMDAAHAREVRGAQAVSCHSKVYVVDQRAVGQDYERQWGTPDTFSTDASNWGMVQFMPLSELCRRDRAYLAHDRIIFRVDLRIVSTRAAQQG